MGYETLVSKTMANPFTLKRRKFLSRYNIWCYNIWCYNIWCYNIWCPQYLKLHKKTHVNLTWDFFINLVGDRRLDPVGFFFGISFSDFFSTPRFFFRFFSRNLEFSQKKIDTPRFFFSTTWFFLLRFFLNWSGGGVWWTLSGVVLLCQYLRND